MSTHAANPARAAAGSSPRSPLVPVEALLASRQAPALRIAVVRVAAEAVALVKALPAMAVPTKLAGAQTYVAAIRRDSVDLPPNARFGDRDGGVAKRGRDGCQATAKGDCSGEDGKTTAHRFPRLGCWPPGALRLTVHAARLARNCQ